ncbi:MAG TPA: hypothetical protein VLM18_00015 [Croceibacterium sp.]|nr:hypothetical protein [Croceibacterium sp.]
MAAVFAWASPAETWAQPLPAVSASASPTYADLVGLTEASAVVAEVTVRDQALIEAERAPGLARGRARLYLETQTQRVLKGPSALGESVSYLADIPFDAKGRPPKLKKQTFLVFANPVVARPGELQLVGPDAQLPLDPVTEQRVRTVIGQLQAPSAAPRITAVRDVISVAGNLAGESETQMFVDTIGGAPVSLTVIRRPNMDPTWGVSWSEIVDQAAKPPERDTLGWYRLACFLPRKLPDRAFLQADTAGRQRAEADYHFILDQLGPCARTLH